MKIISLMSLVVILAGCATAMPNFYNGKYYMAGDSSCQRIRQYTEDKIMCIDGNGKETGWRQAMTDQQLQMWKHNQQMQQQQMQMWKHNQQMQQQQNRVTNTNCYRTYGGGMNCTSY